MYALLDSVAEKEMMNRVSFKGQPLFIETKNIVTEHTLFINHFRLLNLVKSVAAAAANQRRLQKY